MYLLPSSAVYRMGPVIFTFAQPPALLEVTVALSPLWNIWMSTKSLPHPKTGSASKENLDHIDWTDGLAFVTYGLRVGIRVNAPQILDRLKSSFPPGWTRAKSSVVDRLYSIWLPEASSDKDVQPPTLFQVGFDPVRKLPDVDSVISSFESDLHLYVAEYARHKTFIHAGAVGWKGKAILIPGRTMSGKTTLVSELVRAGAIYYSDEFAVLDGRGHVHPFAGLLGIRDRCSFAQDKVVVTDLGGVCGTDPLPVGLIVFCQYKPGRNWSPRRISPAQSVLLLLSNAAAARRKPKSILKTLEKVGLKAKTLKGTRGEAGSVVHSILSALENC
jgi:hypothetical protein